MAVRAYWKGSLKLSLVSCPCLEDTGQAQGRRQAGQISRARGKAGQCHQPDGCAAAKPEGQSIGEAVGAFPGAPGDATPRKKSAPLGGATAQGELTSVMPGLVPGIHVLTASQ